MCLCNPCLLCPVLQPCLHCLSYSHAGSVLVLGLASSLVFVSTFLECRLSSSAQNFLCRSLYLGLLTPLWLLAPLAPTGTIIPTASPCFLVPLALPWSVVALPAPDFRVFRAFSCSSSLQTFVLSGFSFLRASPWSSVAPPSPHSSSMPDSPRLHPALQDLWYCPVSSVICLRLGLHCLQLHLGRLFPWFCRSSLHHGSSLPRHGLSSWFSYWGFHTGSSHHLLCHGSSEFLDLFPCV